MSSVLQITYNADDHDLQDRLPSWQAQIANLFITNTLTDTSELSAAVDIYQFGEIIGGAVSFTPSQFVRTKQTIATSGIDHYLVHLYMKGGFNGVAGGTDININSKDIAIFDLGSTLHTAASSSETLGFLIPKHLIAKNGVSQIPTGTKVDGRSMAGAILSSYLFNLYANISSVNQSNVNTVADSLSALVASTIKMQIDHNEYLSEPLSQALRQRAIAIIDANICNRDLTPAYIATKLKSSRTHLYRAFQSDNGVASMILERRLLFAFRALKDPGNHKLSVASIATNSGFINPQYFSRVFRNMFGITPKDAKTAPPTISAVTDTLTISSLLATSKNYKRLV